MTRISFHQFLSMLLLCTVALFAPASHADDETPDLMVKRLLTDVLDTIKTDKAMRSGDMSKVVALVDTRIMPNVDFQRMTAATVGPAWRQASPEQQKRLQEEFKILLVRAYASALVKVNQQTISMKPLSMGADDKEVLVRAEIRSDHETIQLDYRLERPQSPGTGWRIFNLKVMGAWLVETYRSQFAQEISSRGIDGLISSLSERNKSNSKKA